MACGLIFISMNIRRIIREEMDDLQWIKDVDASKFRPKAGDLIEVRNKGNEYAYYNWLGDICRAPAGALQISPVIEIYSCWSLYDRGFLCLYI